MNKVINFLEKIYLKGNHKIMVCGNGGSVALANHFVCDHQKFFMKQKIQPNMISLSSNSALMTALQMIILMMIFMVIKFYKLEKRRMF